MSNFFVFLCIICALIIKHYKQYSVFNVKQLLVSYVHNL
jgi:hypothetical protein